MGLSAGVVIFDPALDFDGEDPGEKGKPPRALRRGLWRCVPGVVVVMARLRVLRRVAEEKGVVV